MGQVSERCQVLGAQQARYLVLDMAEPQDAERAVGLAADLLGGLDVVVLNHIGSSPFSMWDGDIQHLRWLMQVRGSSAASNRLYRTYTTMLLL